jgi:hypothetical protein
LSLTASPRNINPKDHKQVLLYVNCELYTVANHIYVLIPVETAVIVTADGQDVELHMQIENITFTGIFPILSLPAF